MVILTIAALPKEGPLSYINALTTKNLPTYIYKTEKTIQTTPFTTKHKTKPTYFTRNTAKMTFDKLIAYKLTLPRQSAQIAINNAIHKKDYRFTLDKQSLFEAREKFSHTAFIDLNNNYFLPDYAYTDTNYPTFHKYLIIAIDGSLLDVPPDAAEAFGTYPTNGQPAPKARAVAFVDVLSQYILRAQLKPCSIGESTLAAEMLEEFWSSDARRRDLFLFDRGYFSRSLARKISGHRAKFLFRVRSNCLSEINQATQADQIIICHEEGQADLRLRVINHVMPNGEMERLVTNVFDRCFTVELFGELYAMRWGVETRFQTLKSRLEIEDFSSAKKELVLQDFFASVYVYNLVVAALLEAKEQSVRVAGQKNNLKGLRGRKYVYVPNGAVAISEVRCLLIESFSVEDVGVRRMLFRCAMDAIVRSEVPLRPGRSYEHKVKHKSAKYHLNNKSAL